MLVKRDARITMPVKLRRKDELQLRGKEKPDCRGAQPPSAPTRFFPSALHRFAQLSASGQGLRVAALSPHCFRILLKM